MINTPEYKLANFLDELIKPHIPIRFLLHSTEHFIDSLKQVSYSVKDIMVSFDAVSLFTNVSLPETLKITSNYSYEENRNIPLKEESISKINVHSYTRDIRVQRKTLQTNRWYYYGKPTGPHPS